jgi:hypothetical protein
MPQPFRLYRRSNGNYYLEDAATGKQTNLGTKSKLVAVQRLTAHTQVTEQPYLNLTMARAYLSAKSPEMLSRTWGEIMDDMALGYEGARGHWRQHHWLYGRRARTLSDIPKQQKRAKIKE